MTPEPSSAETDFFEVAARLNLLGAEPDELREEAERLGLPPGEIVVRRGLMDPVQVDIVETLRRPNDAIPGYEVLEVVGRGAMGVVYRARQRNLDRIVALKTVLLGQMSSPSSVERFEQEGRTIGKLRHPNIVAAYDLGRHRGRVFLAMEFVEGTDLERRIRRGGPLDETLVWHIARQTAGGLRHAAKAGVVHRDVKPANIMLVEPPDGFPFPAGIPMVKIADFGLALLVSDTQPHTRLTTENTTLGSPYYMAPEQFESSQVGPAADVYALGATVYHALAGKPPFAGMSVTQIIGAKLTARPEPLESIRAGLAPQTYDLVERLMARDPALRLSDYAELVRAVDEIIGSPVGSRSPAASAVDPASATIVHELDRNAVSTSEIAAATDFVDVASGVAPTSDLVPTRAPDEEFDRTARQSVVDREAAAPTSGAAITAGARPAGGLRGWWLLAAAGPLIALGLGLWIASRVPDDEPTGGPPVPVAMNPGGPVAPLFDGENLDGWRHISGNWVAVVGQPVVSGTDGLLGRFLALSTGPAEWYRLRAMLQPMTGERDGAQEIHFALAAGHPGANGPRHVLRRTRESLQLGTRPRDDGPFEPHAELDVRPADPQEDLGIEIERNPGGWFVSVDGEPFAALPLGDPVLPEFRLHADGGTAWFSDFELMLLERPE